jgi:hypothetical protein
MIDHEKLNLASGESKFDGFLNIDRADAPGVNAIIDLEDFPWPIASNSAKEVVCNHYIEHIPMETYGRRLIRMIKNSDSWESFQKRVNEVDMEAPSDGLIMFMDELYRILKPGGTATFVTPYYQGSIAWQDPTHRRGITEITFQYFNKQWRVNSKLSHYGIKSDFDVRLKGYDYFPDVKYASDDEKKWALRTMNNVVISMYVVLTKKYDIL